MIWMSKKKLIESILELSIPVIAEMTLYTLMWVIDMMLIGKYGGNTSLSVVGLGDEILYTFTDIFIVVGICIGINSLISRKIGGNKWCQAKEYAIIGFFLGLLLSILICLFIYFFRNNILIFAGASNSVLESGNIYLIFSLPGIFFSLIISTICSILRGYGNTKTPCYIALIVSILKILLDLIFIFGTTYSKTYGVKGAACATSISQFIGLIVLGLYLWRNFKHKLNLNQLIKFDFTIFKEITYLSIPSGLGEAAFSISRLLSTFMIMHEGTVAFAANQIATSIESFSLIPGIGFGVAATTMIGFCVGEKNYNKAKKYAYMTTFLTTIMMLICSIIFIFIPTTLVSIFVSENEKEVLILATKCLMLAALEQPFMAIYLVLGGSLKGYGDTKSPFIVSLISSWCIRLPLMFYFIYIKKSSVTYVWWITAFQWAFNAVLIYILFKKKLTISFRKRVGC